MIFSNFGFLACCCCSLTSVVYFFLFLNYILFVFVKSELVVWPHSHTLKTIYLTDLIEMLSSILFVNNSLIRTLRRTTVRMKNISASLFVLSLNMFPAVFYQRMLRPDCRLSYANSLVEVPQPIPEPALGNRLSRDTTQVSTEQSCTAQRNTTATNVRESNLKCFSEGCACRASKRLQRPQLTEFPHRSEN